MIFPRWDLASALFRRFTIAERKHYGLTHKMIYRLIEDYEWGLADIIKKEGQVKINNFGTFYQRHYLAPETYINRKRVGISFKKTPWCQFVRIKEEEIE